MTKQVSADQFRENLNQYAKKYTTPTMSRSVDQKILAMVVKRIVNQLKGPKVLEMGYGDGAWTKAIIGKFGKSHLVDGSSKLLNQAKALYREGLFIYHSYFEEFEPPFSFDSILCSYILEHVVDPIAVLRKLKRWINRNGILVVVVPNATSLHRRLSVVMGVQKDVHELGESDRSIGHRRVYDSSMLEIDLISAGFKVETKIPMMFKPFPNSILSYLTDDQLTGIFNLGDRIPEDERGILAFVCKTT